MKTLFKPVCLLLYLLSVLAFFVFGLVYAGWIGAGKNQGLAGGAIVLGYGVLFAAVALLFALIAAYKLKHTYIVKLNIGLTVLLTSGILLLRYKAQERKEEQIKESQPIEQKTPTKPVANGKLIALANVQKKSLHVFDTPMGIGFFKPNFHKDTLLRFYGNPNFEKPIVDHSSFDEIIFKQSELGNFEISKAPPWLSPAHLKMDYGILFFKVLAIGKTFILIEGNKFDGYSIFVDRKDGELIFWEDFLLTVNSIEFLDPKNQEVKIKPLDSASNVPIAFAYMRPLLVTSEWAKVKLLSDDLSEKGEGWIQWKKNGQLLISYSLLS